MSMLRGEISTSSGAADSMEPSDDCSTMVRRHQSRSNFQED